MDENFEEAPVWKLRRLEHQHSVGEEPSFWMENLPEVASIPHLWST
jgi:hypothetical protein